MYGYGYGFDDNPFSPFTPPIVGGGGFGSGSTVAQPQDRGGFWQRLFGGDNAMALGSLAPAFSQAPNLHTALAMLGQLPALRQQIAEHRADVDYQKQARELERQRNEMLLQLTGIQLGTERTKQKYLPKELEGRSKADSLALETAGLNRDLLKNKVDMIGVERDAINSFIDEQPYDAATREVMRASAMTNGIGALKDWLPESKMQQAQRRVLEAQVNHLNEQTRLLGPTAAAASEDKASRALLAKISAQRQALTARLSAKAREISDFEKMNKDALSVAGFLDLKDVPPQTVELLRKRAQLDKERRDLQSSLANLNESLETLGVPQSASAEEPGSARETLIGLASSSTLAPERLNQALSMIDRAGLTEKLKQELAAGGDVDAILEKYVRMAMSR